MTRKYYEYKDNSNRFTIEIHEESIKQIKMFDRDEEIFYMETRSDSPIIKGVINSLIKLMNDELYQHN